MEMTPKLKMFEQELEMIKKEDHRKLAEFIIEKIAPNKLFAIRPSSTGKYHPRCTMRPGGLVIHIKRLVFFALPMAEAQEYSSDIKDMIIVAAIAHDMCKSDTYPPRGTKVKYTYEDHPIEAVDLLKDHEDRLIKYVDLANLKLVYRMILYHMGRWTPESVKKLLSDYTQPEMLFYMADYLSAQKQIVTVVDNIALEIPKEETK
jgi:HD superfamily phosphohydrolase YqeK